MISALIEKPRLAGLPYIVTDPIGLEAEDRVRRGGRPVWHLPQTRMLSRREREFVARVRAAELGHLRHPDRWVARKRRQYEIDSLVERYQDVIRGAPGPVYHGPGALVGTPSPLAPMAILAADGVTVEQYCHADLDVAVSGGAGTAWGDLSVSSFDYDTPGAVGTEPTYIERASSIGYRNYLDFDGTNDHMFASGLAIPRPSTRASWLWAVWLHDSWVTSRRNFCDATAVSPPNSPLTENASPEIRQRASNSVGVNAITDFAIDTWGELISWSNDATSDYFKLGGTTVTGQNSSSGTEADGTGRRIGTNPGVTNFTDMWVAAVMYAQSNPSTDARAALRVLIHQYWGSLVLV